MSLQVSASVGALKFVDVTITGDLIEVTPDHLHICAGESVQWRFKGIQDGRRPEIRFLNPPSATQVNCGPFSNVLVGWYPDPNAAKGSKIYTITGANADTVPYSYQYEARLITVATGECVGCDPIIENEGPPNR